MIVWINGTYGVGKTSTANEIKIKMTNKEVVVFDPDDLFESKGEDIIKDLIKNGGGVSPQNNRFFLHLLFDELKKYFHNDTICIVPMSITSIEGKELVWEYISKNCDKYKHFVLDAEEEIIRERIRQDTNRADKGTAIYELSTNRSFINKYFENAEWINTSHKKIGEVAQEIIEEMEL